jgi:tetratricopeptide (TPR) repeat protein
MGDGIVKKIGFFFFSIFVLSTAPVFTQVPSEKPYWFTLEQGKLFFRTGEYGDALLAFEDAREQRKTMYTQMEQHFITLLSIPEVRRMGDSLDLVEAYIADQRQQNAAAALRELYYRLPKGSLAGSARTALERLGGLKNYPEAEFWIGEVYRAEGELGIALRQYQRAYEQRAFLENSGFEREILYKIVDIHRLRQEYQEMEGRLLEIVEQDALWSEDTGIFAKTAMTRTMENDGITRFLTLYRYNNASVEKAHRLLGLYYYTSGRHSRAVEHLLYAFLIQNTIIIEEILRNQFDFTFRNLENLRNEIVRRPVLSAYTDEAEYYKTMYYLGSAFYGAGKPVPARELWTFLAIRDGNGRFPAGEWGARARDQLRSPSLEPVVEYP